MHKQYSTILTHFFGEDLGANEKGQQDRKPLRGKSASEREGFQRLSEAFRGLKRFSEDFRDFRGFFEALSETLSETLSEADFSAHLPFEVAEGFHIR